MTLGEVNTAGRSILPHSVFSVSLRSSSSGMEYFLTNHPRLEVFSRITVNNFPIGVSVTISHPIGEMSRWSYVHYLATPAGNKHCIHRNDQNNKGIYICTSVRPSRLSDNSSPKNFLTAIQYSILARIIFPSDVPCSTAQFNSSRFCFLTVLRFQ